MAFAQDVLTRIVNVQFGGGTVFVYGTNVGNNLYYIKFKGSTDEKPQALTVTLPGEPPANYEPDSPNFLTTGGSYALVINHKDTPSEERKPTFLVCGHRIVDSHYYSLIYASNDGLDWSAVFTKDAGSNDPETSYIERGVALVWEPVAKKFYFDEYSAVLDHPTGAGSSAKEEILGSPDGHSWGAVSSSDIDLDSPSSSHPSAFPSYCAHNNCLDERGQHVPDGNMGRGTGMVARPVKSLVCDYGAGVVGYSQDISARVEILDDAGNSFVRDIPGIDRVVCVAAAGGILVAGGEVNSGHTGATAFSLDGGNTWKQLTITPDPVATIVAAPASDLSG